MRHRRLKTIASFVNELDKVIDVGSDHGYLSIYLKEMYPSIKVLATDISSNALSYAINNIASKGLDIDTLVTDGLNNIELDLFNTVIIAGMGTSTILNILNVDLKDIQKLIIQSNNELSVLRKGISKLGYYLEEVKVVCENDKYYEVMLFTKSSKVNTNDELEYGVFHNDYSEYYKFLISKYKFILTQLPDGDSKIVEIQNKINYFTSLF